MSPIAAFFAVPETSRAPTGFPQTQFTGGLKSSAASWIRRIRRQRWSFSILGVAQDRLTLLPEYKATARKCRSSREQLPYIKAVTAGRWAGGGGEGRVEWTTWGIQAVHWRKGHDADREFRQDFARSSGTASSSLLPPRLRTRGWLERLDAAGLAEKFGVPAPQIPDYLALVALQIPGSRCRTKPQQNG